MTYEEVLKSEGYIISSDLSNNPRPFEAAVKVGNLIFVSGHAGKVNGELLHKGIVGKDVSIEQAQKTAIAAFVNCLNATKSVIKDLDNINKIVNIKGYVASTPDFIDQPKVLNSVTNLVNKVFGESGKHSRIAVGASSLPGGTSVEIEMIIEVK